jgi:hypothetical protein
MENKEWETFFNYRRKIFTGKSYCSFNFAGIFENYCSKAKIKDAIF